MVKLFKGIISGVRSRRMEYEVLQFDKEENEFVIPFLNSGEPFIVGDVVDFELQYSFEKLGYVAVKAQLIYNKNFRELRDAFSNRTSIQAVAYKRNDNGLLVSYKGYRCLLRYDETSFNDKRFPHEPLLNKFLDYEVMGLNGQLVSLTRKRIEHEEFLHKEGSPFQQPEPGMSFTGIIFRRMPTQVVVCFSCYNGILPVRNIFHCSIAESKKVFRLGSTVTDFNKDVFTKKETMKVVVKKMEQGFWYLDWDPNDAENIAIKEKFVAAYYSEKYKAIKSAVSFSLHGYT